MAAEEVLEQEQEQDQEETAGSADGKRERSTVKFPYGDLADAIEVAKGVRNVSSTCEWEQLAAQLKQSPGGGGFRMKMLTAKIFGVVDYSKGRVTLTQLGQRLCDPKQEKAAKGDAFLAVPLYKQIYEKFKGVALPPASALEAEMAGMGVAEKQTDKARQYFQRSAEQAGFFWSGSDRLVMPPVNEGEHRNGRAQHEEDTRRKDNDSGDDGGDGRHPLIEGLIKTLKTLPQNWPIEARKKWLQTAANIFDMAYPSNDGRSIKVEIEKEPAQ